MKHLISFILFAFIHCCVSAQEVGFNKESILVKVSDQKEIIYTHSIKKSETLYSLARFFKIPVQDLMLINDIEPEQTIPLETKINIPINPSYIIKDVNKSDPDWIPIFYKVKKKETLYRISKGYFSQNIQQLMGRNKLTKLSLRLNQELLVGWWPRQFNNKDFQTTSTTTNESFDFVVSDTSSHLNVNIDTITQTHVLDSVMVNVPLPKIHSVKGIAIWERSDPNDDFLFVLHKNANVGSIIKLQHPVTNNVVVAKVVEKLPQGICSPDVDLIISKAVAQKLGALETRFQVSMTYYQ